MRESLAESKEQLHSWTSLASMTYDFNPMVTWFVCSFRIGRSQKGQDPALLPKVVLIVLIDKKCLYLLLWDSAI